MARYRTKTLFWVPTVVIVALCLSFYVSLSFEDRSILPSALIDQPMPAFELPQLDQEQLADNSDLPQDQPYLVNVWSTWCAPCLIEHPVLMNVASGGIPIVGVNYKDEDEKASKWLFEKGDPYTINVVDRTGNFSIDLGLAGVPVTFVVDARGMIRKKHMGAVTQSVWENQLLPTIQAIADDHG